jgi:hypothetical protein
LTPRPGAEGCPKAGAAGFGKLGAPKAGVPNAGVVDAPPVDHGDGFAPRSEGPPKAGVGVVVDGEPKVDLAGGDAKPKLGPAGEPKVAEVEGAGAGDPNVVG